MRARRWDAALLAGGVDRLLFDLGAKGDWGISLEGVMARPELLAEAGPEELFREARIGSAGANRTESIERKKLIVACPLEFTNQAGWKWTSAGSPAWKKRDTADGSP